MTWIGWLGLALIGLALAAGCEQGSDRPATYGVSGTVTLDGTAVEGATVTFAPSATGGTPAVGTTNASGKYSLMSFGTENGALPGKYTVSITKFTFADAGGGGGGDDTEMPANYGGADDEQAGGQNELPDNYASPRDSGLTATVTESASQNVFDFPLTSGGAAPAGGADSPE